MRGAPGGSMVPPDLSRYRLELAAMIRTGSADAYRAFLREWSDLHQRGVAERLITMDDAALLVRIARMALSDRNLSDAHDWARSVLVEADVTVVDEPPVATGIASGRVSRSRVSQPNDGLRGLPRVRRTVRVRVSRPPRSAKPDGQG